MSDGPHRSLPLPAHWRGVTLAAFTPSYGLTEVEEKIRYAVERDITRAPVAKLCKVLDDAYKDTLFVDERHLISELQALRFLGEAPSLSQALSECAIAAVYEGVGDQKQILHHALQIWYERHRRSIEEHVRREAPRGS